jgi:light-regulated signal transduction histidine kinase (bacteriophytochrome)
LIVQGDPILLRVMLENLLSNAWKFTSKRSEARIEFGARSEGRDIVYFVCDDGVGFDMKYVSKLFGAFQRLHDASEFPGTGIGLASVQRIVSRHGGRIWAEGTVGKGATFCFVLSSETPALRSLDMCDEKEVFSQSSGVGESRE